MKTTRTLRLSLLILIAVLIGTAGKLTVDSLAADKLAAAREMAEGRVSTDVQAVDKLKTELMVDKHEVDRLAKEVVPTRREMYVDGPIHAGDSFAGMVGSNGFSGGPFHIRIVPDAEAASKLAAERKAAADKLAADEVAAKRAVDTLAKDRVEADKLAKETVRWQDAFGGVHE